MKTREFGQKIHFLALISIFSVSTQVFICYAMHSLMIKHFMCMIRENNLPYGKKLIRSIYDMKMLTSRDFYMTSDGGQFGPQHWGTFGQQPNMSNISIFNLFAAILPYQPLECYQWSNIRGCGQPTDFLTLSLKSFIHF